MKIPDFIIQISGIFVFAVFVIVFAVAVTRAALWISHVLHIL